RITLAFIARAARHERATGPAVGSALAGLDGSVAGIERTRIERAGAGGTRLDRLQFGYLVVFGVLAPADRAGLAGDDRADRAHRSHRFEGRFGAAEGW